MPILVAVAVLIGLFFGASAMGNAETPQAPRKPRGFRNNNPGNLRYYPEIPWKGQLGADAAGYAVFDTPENGIRAMSIQILGDIEKRGFDTPRKLITKYAPPSENDTKAYIQAVCKRLGVLPDDKLSERKHGLLLVYAVGEHENGKPLSSEYSLITIRTAYNSAVSYLGV